MNEKQENSVSADPSSLTTAQLQREIASLKELIFSELNGIKDAVKVAHADLVRVPTDTQEAVKGLKELHAEKFTSAEKLMNEKFSGVEKQFKERDTRIEQSSKDSKVAVDAALQAAKELVAQQNISVAEANTKQENSFSKLISAQGELIVTQTKASDDKIDDLKENFNKIEINVARLMSEGNGKNEGSKNTMGIVASVIGIIVLIITIINLVHNFTIPGK
jgi:hypothetical protein